MIQNAMMGWRLSTTGFLEACVSFAKKRYGESTPAEKHRIEYMPLAIPIGWLPEKFVLIGSAKLCLLDVFIR